MAAAGYMQGQQMYNAQEGMAPSPTQLPLLRSQRQVPVPTHRGAGSFVPMSSHGSASRTMSPRPRQVPSTGPGRRYGSAEHSSDHGVGGGGGGRSPSAARSDRERDRNREPRGMPATRQMGPQETADWDALIDSIQGRIDALERTQRQQAQFFAKTHEAGEQMRVVAEKLAEDYPAYKDYCQGRFTAICEDVQKEVTVLNHKMSVADNNVIQAGDRFGINEERI